MTTTSASGLKRPLTAAEVATYAGCGAVLVKDILDQRVIASLAAGLEAAKTEPGAMGAVSSGGDGRGTSHIDQYPSQRHPQLAEFIAHSGVAQIASELLGGQAVSNVLDQAFYKEAGTILPTLWHQDTPYLRMEGTDLVRLWATCDPSPRAVTVKVVKGSHLWNVTYRPVGADNGVRVTYASGAFSYGLEEDYDATLPHVPDIDAHPDAFDVMEWDVEPGDILAFNGNVLHGAGGVANHPSRRRAYATLWAGDDVRYRRRPGISIPDRLEFQGAEMADGQRLAERRDVFPVMWPVSGDEA